MKLYQNLNQLPIVMKKFEFKDGESIRTEEDEVVNDASAIWARNKKDIKPKEYEEFYKNLTYDQEPPLSVFHNRVEGNQEYVSLLFIPSKAPFDLYDRDKAQGVKLYAKRIFIMEANEKLIPQYLRFMKGVIDSSDLPLTSGKLDINHSSTLSPRSKTSIFFFLNISRCWLFLAPRKESAVM